jgi:hypothetical protein
MSIVFDGTTWAQCEIPALAGAAARIDTTDVGGGWQRVRLAWRLDAPLARDAEDLGRVARIEGQLVLRG